MDRPKSQHGMIDGSSIVEMEIMDEDDPSDYELNFANTAGQLDTGDEDGGQMTNRSQQQPQTKSFESDIRGSVTSMVWEAGTQQAKKAFSIYGNIDVLRPYFDVEPKEVRNRLLRSLLPVLPNGSDAKVPRELYGPTMLVFTLIALLLFQMKTSGHVVQEGTLMGTAFAVCFGYWLGVSSFLGFLAYICNTKLTMLQVLSLIGYGLFGYCLVLFLGTVIHTSHDHLMFYVLWAFIGGLSSLRLVSILMARTSGRTQKLIVAGIAATLHMLFLLYLHFAYHQIVEDLSSALQGDKPQPIRYVPPVMLTPENLPPLNPTVAEVILPKHVTRAIKDMALNVHQMVNGSVVLPKHVPRVKE